MNQELVEKLTKEIADYVTLMDHVTFAELNKFEGFEGDYFISTIQADEKNIFLWSRLSEEAAEALSVLLKKDTFHYEPCNPLIYFLDGACSSAPVAKRVRAYKKPHWLPVVLVKGPDPLEEK